MRRDPSPAPQAFRSATAPASGWNRLPSRLASASYWAYFSSATACAAASSSAASSGLTARQTAIAQFVVGVVFERDGRARRIEAERRLAGVAHRRIEAEQRPVAAGGRQVLLPHAVAQIEAVGDAMAVGEDQRRPGPGLGLAERQQGLLRIGAHRHLRDIDVAVGDGLQARGPCARRACRRRRIWRPRRAASPWTPGRRCWNRPRCRAPAR